MEKFQPARRFANVRENVWLMVSGLATAHKAVNLGSGFPNMPPAAEVAESLQEASSNPLIHQEPLNSQGHPRLVNALRNLYSPLVERTISTEEIVVTIGAYEAFYLIFTSLLNEGDEVILLEPFFDCYEAMIYMAGGVPVYVTLRPDSSGNWTFDRNELRSKFSKKTKLIVVNTPQNPMGKIYNQDELLCIADLCKEFDVVAAMDEVYEWTAFDGHHIRMASLPGMWERTITVGSAGKSFSVTGWHIGWAYGPKYLIDILEKVHSLSTKFAPTVLQEATAICVEKMIPSDSSKHWSEVRAKLKKNRDIICDILEHEGFKVFRPQAAYFVVADFTQYRGKPSSIADDEETPMPPDLRFAKWLCENKKISAIPLSGFYSENNAHEAKNWLRFSYYKDDETLKRLAENLA